MKYKYSIHKDDQKQDLTIIEYANLDKEILTPIAKEVYSEDTISKAVLKGTNALIALLRTKNMFPPGILALRLAETITSLYERRQDSYAEILFDESVVIGAAKRGPEESVITERFKAVVGGIPDEDFEDAAVTGGREASSVKLEELELIETGGEYQDDSDALEDDLGAFDDDDDDV